MKRFLLIIFALLAMACSSHSPQYRAYTPNSHQKSKIAWKSYDPALFAMASHTKKPALLYFESKSCHVCKKMNNEALTDPVVIHTTNDYFVPIKITEEDNSDLFYQLSERYEIKYVPHFVVLTYPDYQKSVIKSGGYMDINVFMVFLKISKEMEAILNLQTISNGLLVMDY